jgi:tRNA(Ile)-lysidine synthase TilS/MesJ
LYPNKSYEELAREKRYQFFDAVMNIYNSKYVLTAHHLDDRIETMLFNMLRGTKLT